MFRTRTRRRIAGLAAAVAAALALVGCSGTSGGSPAATFDPDEKVTLSFTWWGNDARADFYERSIALFEQRYPNITVDGTFADYPGYWQKRTTEAAGGGLPDVMQFDYSQLTTFGSKGLLLDLKPQYGENIDVSKIAESALDSADLDGKSLGLLCGTNVWAMWQDTAMIESAGRTAYAGGTSWDDYFSWMEAATTASEQGRYGGTNPTQRIQNLEIWLRQQGKDLYTEDGGLGFTQDDMRTFLASASDLRSSGAVIPQKRLEELYPVGGLGANLTDTELSYDNFGASIVADSGKQEGDLALTAPPTADPAVKDLFLKPAMLLSISARTPHAAAAAKFVDFLTNSPEVGAIFGGSRGIPSSSSQLAGAELTGLDAAAVAYEKQVADRIGDAPPLPPAAAANLEQKFWDLGKSVDLGAVTIDDAVKQFFAEASTELNG